MSVSEYDVHISFHDHSFGPYANYGNEKKLDTFTYERLLLYNLCTCMEIFS